MRTFHERVGDLQAAFDLFGDRLKAELRSAIPGIVQSFDPEEQTVTVQPAIRERIRDVSGNMTWVDLPLLTDVPVVFPRAGGFVLTMPVSPGDECLVVFSDMCIDGWWASGGVQNQAECRRHDLSDAFAIMGTWSQPNVVPNYSPDAAQLRTEDGSTRIDLRPGVIDLVAASVRKNGVPI